MLWKSNRPRHPSVQQQCESTIENAWPYATHYRPARITSCMGIPQMEKHMQQRSPHNTLAIYLELSHCKRHLTGTSSTMKCTDDVCSLCYFWDHCNCVNTLQAYHHWEFDWIGLNMNKWKSVWGNRISKFRNGIRTDERIVNDCYSCRDQHCVW